MRLFFVSVKFSGTSCARAAKRKRQSIWPTHAVKDCRFYYTKVDPEATDVKRPSKESMPLRVIDG